MDKVLGYICEKCQKIFEKNEIGESRLCPHCRISLTKISPEYIQRQAGDGGASKGGGIFGIFYCNLLGLVVGVPAILFRGVVFSYGISMVEILAVISLVSAGVLSLAVFLQKISSSRLAEAISWIAIVLLIIVSSTGYVQAGDLIDAIDRNVMRMITSGVPLLNITILFVNLLRFSEA